jgi:hypothetical protein
MDRFPFKVGLLSYPFMLENFPENDFINEKNILNRGSFITPLYEETLSKLEHKHFELLMLHVEPPDFSDWADEMNEIFCRVRTLDPAELGENKQQIENNLYRLVSDSTPQKLLLSCDDGLITEWPEGSKVLYETNGISIEIESDRQPLISRDFYLSVSSLKKQVPLKIKMTFQDGSEDEICVAVAASMPEELDEQTPSGSLFDDEAQDFRRIAGQLAITEQTCNPLRRSPFFCTKTARGSLFPEEEIVFNSIKNELGNDMKEKYTALLFIVNQDSVRWKASAKTAFKLNDRILAALASGDLIYIYSFGDDGIQGEAMNSSAPGTFKISENVYAVGLPRRSFDRIPG